MTEKHFKALATIVREHKCVGDPQLWDAPRNGDEERKILAYKIANLCASLNERFDRARFYEACGVTLDKEE